MREVVSAVRSWRSVVEGGAVAGLEDGQLLERFAREGSDASEAAFAALVARHGPMVRRVCRQWLGNPHDADDAFQATFLVLARKARGIRHPERLANWLFGTANRASRRLRADLTRRKRHESARRSACPHADPDRSEVAAIVLEEVSNLPTECRVAVVFCDLEGLTQDEAASRLGCSDRTLRRRLCRAHELLRSRLRRRGLGPPDAMLVVGPGLVPESLIDATARLCRLFANGRGAAGTVPASASALTLAEGILKSMTWTKFKAVAAVAGCLLALGGGSGIASGFWGLPPRDLPPNPKPAPKVEAAPARPKSSPAERYKAMVRRWDDALKAYQAEAAKANSPEEVSKVWERMGPFARDYSPDFVALAEEFPADPVAVDALMWVANQALSSFYNPDSPDGRAYARALEILARDHPDEPRLADYCPMLSWSPARIKTQFLRVIADRSKDRLVRGRATLALAESLRADSAMAELFQGQGLPEAFVAWVTPTITADELRKMKADPASYRRSLEETYGRPYMADHLGYLKKADFAALRAESDRAFARVEAEFAALPAAPRPVASSGADGRPARPLRETLGRVAERLRSTSPRVEPPPSRYEPLAAAYKAAEKKAQEAAGQGEPDLAAYFKSAPKWSDFGPKMVAIAESAPRTSEAFDALLWIVGHPWPFRDSGEERAEAIGRAVDALVRDHLDEIGERLDAPEIEANFNHWHAFPVPHVDRLYRALAERGATREIRGRMALMLGQLRKAEADLVESLDARGDDPEKRPEVAMFPPSYLAGLRKAGRGRLDDVAAAILEGAKSEYGDLHHANGPRAADVTLAAVVDRELADIRTLAAGQTAPEIRGEDVEGKPMALAEFRGRVLVLDFGTHEHCGGCRLVYPRQRELVEKLKGRPFTMLGVNSGDKRGVLRDLLARNEVTWRCWFDGDDPLRPGPIFTRWNIQGYPTFIVLDHRGTIRYKDMHPFDPEFSTKIEALVKEAEAARR